MYRENIILTIIGTIAALGVLLHKYVIQTMEIDSTMFGQEAHLLLYMVDCFNIGFLSSSMFLCILS